MDQGSAGTACCAGPQTCVFAKALLARAATCEFAQRSARAEQEVLTCCAPTARVDCATMAALLHERARFALRLPAPGRPMLHVHAMRLQCGGLAALRTSMAVTEGDVRRLLVRARERHGTLAELPWGDIVADLVRWKPRRPPRVP